MARCSADVQAGRGIALGGYVSSGFGEDVQKGFEQASLVGWPAQGLREGADWRTGLRPLLLAGIHFFPLIPPQVCFRRWLEGKSLGWYRMVGPSLRSSRRPRHLRLPVSRGATAIMVARFRRMQLQR